MALKARHGKARSCACLSLPPCVVLVAPPGARKPCTMHAAAAAPNQAQPNEPTESRQAAKAPTCPCATCVGAKTLDFQWMTASASSPASPCVSCLRHCGAMLLGTSCACERASAELRVKQAVHARMHCSSKQQRASVPRVPKRRLTQAYTNYTSLPKQAHRAQLSTRCLPIVRWPFRGQATFVSRSARSMRACLLACPCVDVPACGGC